MAHAVRVLDARTHARTHALTAFPQQPWLRESGSCSAIRTILVLSHMAYSILSLFLRSHILLRSRVCSSSSTYTQNLLLLISSFTGSSPITQFMHVNSSVYTDYRITITMEFHSSYRNETTSLSYWANLTLRRLHVTDLRIAPRRFPVPLSIHSVEFRSEFPSCRQSPRPPRHISATFNNSIPGSQKTHRLSNRKAQPQLSLL